MSDSKNGTPAEKNDDQQQYSLNDDRRVKVLSPGALIAKRFFRNRLAVHFPRGQIAGLPDRGQHALAHIRAHIGAVVQHAVHGSS